LPLVILNVTPSIMNRLRVIFTLSIASCILSAKEHEHLHLNIARPDEHPYVDPEGGRDGLRLANKEQNEFRVYNFYQRQADYYMQYNDGLKVIPSFPGLDAGLHGHWGKYNQNNHNDDRWNDMQHDGIYGGYIVSDVYKSEDGIGVMLDKERELYTVFSPRNYNFMLFAKGEFLKIDGRRWGNSKGATVKGKMTSFKMLNNPNALEMQYVPNMKEVIAFTYVVQPKGLHELYFKAPTKKGSYTFFCSFPGHWQLMKGKLIVE